MVMIMTSLLSVPALWLAGMDLLSLTSSEKTESANGFTMAAELQVHWPLIAICAVGLLGLVALVWPQQPPPRLRS